MVESGGGGGVEQEQVEGRLHQAVGGQQVRVGGAWGAGAAFGTVDTRR